MGVFDLALQNLFSPMVLFFILGLCAAFARSDLNIPEPIAKLLALYLLMAIGFKGGVEVAHNGLTFGLVATIAAGVFLSFVMPVLAYAMLRLGTGLSKIDAAAVAAHYGSISAVTFAAITGVLAQLSMPYEGYMAAVAAAMETPAIFSALILVRRAGKAGKIGTNAHARADFMREVALNGSIVILLGAFLIGALTGARGFSMLKPFLFDLFPGFLCLFLLDMGLVAGRGLAQGRKHLTPAVVLFGFVMPLVGATLAAPLAILIGLSAGGAAVLITLAASASYIAVPAAMRLALPQANPAISLTLALGVTFPFNLLIGIPLYIWLATRLAG